MDGPLVCAWAASPMPAAATVTSSTRKRRPIDLFIKAPSLLGCLAPTNPLTAEEDRRAGDFAKPRILPDPIRLAVLSPAPCNSSTPPAL